MTKAPVVKTAGPRDDLVKKDVYREDVLAAANTYMSQNPTVTRAGEYLKSLGNNPSGLLGDVTGSVKSTGTGLELDASSMRKRLMGTLGVGSFINDLTDGMKTDFLSTMMGVEGAEAKMLINDVEYAMAGGTDALSATGIADTINRLTGNAGLVKFLDIGGQVGIVRYLSGMLSDIGAFTAIDELIATIKDEKEKNAMLEEMAIRSARMGDLDAVEHFVDGMGGGRAYAVREELCTAIVSYFKFPFENQQPWAIYGEKISALMSKIDAGWWLDERKEGGGDLKYLCVCSEDAYTALTNLSTAGNAKNQAIVTFTIAASTIKSESVDMVLRTSFPQVPTWSN